MSRSVRQLTREEVIKLADSCWWEYSTSHEIAAFELGQRLLCCPFVVLQQALQDVLGRPVFSHEFMDPDALRDEMAGDVPTPTFEDIIALIPESKRITIEMEGEQP